ncbi:phage antirepressor KilAC domain-containing protein [Bacteroides congonensis]|uniref:phage antirepressor KilAC domain-containing protein n=1 Tax=Bacteroides congonensis TaxID=1871006 RepID=UPI0023F99ECA|nr:phage antirepressor KilAC domain-containing protein [Bacteroides congonensis]
MKALTKTSSNEEIKAYFKAVFELSRSEEDFPVDIDEVWMLVYNRRDYAIDALKKEFIEKVDYACTSVKTEVGSTKYKYHITVSCLEYFIARKVRPVFEVYRQVFHKTGNKPEYFVPRNYLEALKALVSSEEEKQLLELENRQLNEENERNLPKVEFAESIMQSPTCISVGEMANILKQNKLFNKGQNALYEYLRFNRYLLSRGGRRNLPSQKSINMGIMKIAENYSETERAIIINRKAVITPYGQKFFLELFRKRKEINGNMITLF